jgi:hypothetical protein
MRIIAGVFQGTCRNPVLKEFGLSQKLREKRQVSIRRYLSIIVPQNSYSPAVRLYYRRRLSIFSLTRRVSLYQLAIFHIPEYYQEFNLLQAFSTAEFRVIGFCILG